MIDESPETIPFSPGAGVPRAVIDAGGEPWDVLMGMISQRIAELGPGDLLEVSSGDPSHRMDLMAWTRITGHDLFQLTADGRHTWFWIRKR